MSDDCTKDTYTGTKALKSSQTYCMAFGKAVASLARTWVTEVHAMTESEGSKADP